MTTHEASEYQALLDLLDSIDFDFGRFGDELDEIGFQFEDISKGGWWWYKTKHGQLTYTMKPLSGGPRVTFCSYIPSSSGQQVPLVVAGRSKSGKSLPDGDLREIQKDFSHEAIEDRVLLSTASEAGFSPNDVTPETNIVDDLLYGDEFDKEFLLDNIFLELSAWFDFESPDLYEEAGNFETVRDIINYVKEHVRS